MTAVRRSTDSLFMRQICLSGQAMSMSDILKCRCWNGTAVDMALTNADAEGRLGGEQTSGGLGGSPRRKPEATALEEVVNVKP